MTLKKDRVSGDIAKYCPQYVYKTTVLSTLDNESARTPLLDPGYYRVVSAGIAHINQGDSTVEATATDYALGARVREIVFVSGTDDNYLAGRAWVGSSVVYISKVCE